MIKILIAGILGGLAIFIAGFITHMLTPLGLVGVSTVPTDDAVQACLRSNMPGVDGLYIFPAIDPSKMNDPAAQAAWSAKNKSGGGLIVYHPNGAAEFGPKPLLLELASNIFIALIAAFIVSLTSASFVQRVIVVSLLGVLAWGSISISYLNWYGFPPNFTLAEGVDQLFAFLLCGLVVAFVFRRHQPAAQAA